MVISLFFYCDMPTTFLYQEESQLFTPTQTAGHTLDEIPGKNKCEHSEHRHVRLTYQSVILFVWLISHQPAVLFS
jgi:hypothetical protein